MVCPVLTVWRYTSAFPSTLRHGQEPGGRGSRVSTAGPRTLNEGLRSQGWDFPGCSRSRREESPRSCPSPQRDASALVGMARPREGTAGTAARRLCRKILLECERTDEHAYVHGCAHTGPHAAAHALDRSTAKLTHLAVGPKHHLSVMWDSP